MSPLPMTLPVAIAEDWMARSRTYPGVTRETFDRLRAARAPRLRDCL